MPDFGEALVDIRDSLQTRLPVRVKPGRIFLRALLISFGSLLLSVVQGRRFTSLLPCPDFEADMDDVKNAFRSLEGLRCTAEQIQQASDLLRVTLIGYHRHANEELDKWHSAARAGLFFGHLTIFLCATSSVICLFTGRVWGQFIFLGCFMAIEGVASLICLRQWHHSS